MGTPSTAEPSGGVVIPPAASSSARLGGDQPNIARNFSWPPRVWRGVVVDMKRGEALDSAGGGEGFAAVYDEHHARLVRLAFLLAGDTGRAEDMVAEAFALVYPHWLRGEVADPASYLRGSVVNQANARFRRLRLERREAAKHSADNRAPKPLEDHAADSDVLARSLAALPRSQRAAIVLRYFEDLTEAQTAETLGVSIGTVKSSVSRGLGRLRLLIDHQERRSDG